MVGRLADKPPKAGMALEGVLVRQGLKDIILHKDDLATFTKLRTGAVQQKQSLLLARPWMQVCPAWLHLSSSFLAHSLKWCLWLICLFVPCRPHAVEGPALRSTSKPTVCHLGRWRGGQCQETGMLTLTDPARVEQLRREPVLQGGNHEPGCQFSPCLVMVPSQPLLIANLLCRPGWHWRSCLRGLEAAPSLTWGPFEACSLTATSF